MVTKLRKAKNIPETSSNSSYSGGYPMIFLHDGVDTLHIRSTEYPELYKEYTQRKDINVDFSSAKTPEDIEILRKKFEAGYKSAPSKEYLNIIKKTYKRSKSEDDTLHAISQLAYAIKNDLAQANVSEKRYIQILEYLKNIIIALIDGKDINAVKELPTSTMHKILNKISYTDPLGYTKNCINERADKLKNATPVQLANLIKKLPKQRIISAVIDENINPDVYKYMNFFEAPARESRDKYSVQHRKYAELLMKNKIKVDGLRTFDKLAEQHLNQLKKEKNQKEVQKLKEAKRALNKKAGLSKQRIANMHGPVDPVARSIAKIRKSIEHR